jgi:hypothetical protein
MRTQSSTFHSIRYTTRRYSGTDWRTVGNLLLVLRAGEGCFSNLIYQKLYRVIGRIDYNPTTEKRQ